MVEIAPRQYNNLLERLGAGEQAFSIALAELIESIWVPRYIRFTETAFTLLPEHRGARILFTNAGAITFASPDSLPVGFMCSWVQLGAGVITFSNVDVGGTTSPGQYSAGSLERLDDGSWLLLGGA